MTYCIKLWWRWQPENYKLSIQKVMKSEARLVLLASYTTYQSRPFSKEVGDGWSCFFVELMLFIGFKYKLNMTMWVSHRILLTQHNTTSLALEATLGCTALENCQQRGSKSTVSLVSHKAPRIVYKTQKVSYNSSVTSYIINASVWKGVHGTHGTPPGSATGLLRNFIK